MSAPPHRRHTEDQPDVEQKIRSLLAEGQIWEAQQLLKSVGEDVPVDPKLREILGPTRVRRSSFRDVDRSAEFHWLKTKAAEYEGKWVALVGESLVASSDTLKELLARLAELKLDREPLIHHLI
ncbi:MAG TPA: DUF5678 domain-containing protein [Thermoanaerobaculia bacterium]|nr:DUF5678 domain-containing protein [Thermoanaerobaculia bacterium]